MRCLLIDDEAPARRELRQLLSVHPGVEVVGEAANVADALELTARHRPTVVFLDIRLRGETGFDFVARLSGEHAPRIVFVTAFDRHAARAFDCNALDYLLKPVLPARLADTLRRVTSVGKSVPPAPARDDDSVFVRDDGIARFVRWSEILRISSEGNYTRLYLEDGASPLMLRPLKDWLSLAPPAIFRQIHRAHLVRLSAIDGMRRLSEGRHAVVLADGTELPIGRAYRAALRQWQGLQHHGGAEDTQS